MAVPAAQARPSILSSAGGATTCFAAMAGVGWYLFQLVHKEPEWAVLAIRYRWVGLMALCTVIVVAGIGTLVYLVRILNRPLNALGLTILVLVGGYAWAHSGLLGSTLNKAAIDYPTLEHDVLEYLPFGDMTIYYSYYCDLQRAQVNAPLECALPPVMQ